jgi:hypothetical protein
MQLFKAVLSLARALNAGPSTGGPGGGYANGYNADLCTDPDGALWVRAVPSVAPPLAFNIAWASVYAATGPSMVATLCTLVSLHAWHESAAPLWLHLFDALAVPAPGSTPALSIPIPPLPGTTSLDLSAHGYRFSIGMSAALSTTGPTYTASAANMWLKAAYTL